MIQRFNTIYNGWLAELVASQHIQRYVIYICDDSAMYAYITKLRLTTKIRAFRNFIERDENMVFFAAKARR